MHGADRSNLQRFDGKFQIIGRTGGRSKVKNVTPLPLPPGPVRSHLCARTGSGYFLSRCSTLAALPGDQVVERQNIPALLQQSVAKMRSQKSRSAGHHRSHAASQCRKTLSLSCRWKLLPIDFRCSLCTDRLRRLTHGTRRVAFVSMQFFLLGTILPSSPADARPRDLARCFVSFLFFGALTVFLNLGRWLDREDPLEKASAIAVLSGRMPEPRPGSCANLYAGLRPGSVAHPFHGTRRHLAKLSVPYSGEDIYDKLILAPPGRPGKRHSNPRSTHRQYRR